MKYTKHISVVLFIVSLLFPAFSWGKSVGGPHLWLSLDSMNFDKGGQGYVKDDPDPWLKKSYVTNESNFDLYLYNPTKAHPKKGRTANDLSLLTFVHAGESGTVKVNDVIYSTFTNTVVKGAKGLKNKGLYKHGSSFDDVRYAIIPLMADLLPGDFISLEIEWSGFSQVHFDAVSSNCFYNLPNHDVTAIVPTPPTMILFGSGLVCLVGIGARKKIRS